MLPIVQRELLEATRQPATRWSRWWAAAAALGAFFVLTNLRGVSSVQALADILFGLLSGSLLLYACFAGALQTVDVLSSERRGQTLGLLFLTDLRTYDIVLGKLVSSSVRSLYVLLGILPVLALPILLGGVSSTQFIHMTVLLLSTTVLSLVLGLMVSAWQERMEVSLGWFLSVVVGATLGWACYGCLRTWWSTRGLPTDFAQWFPKHPLGLWWSILGESRFLPPASGDGFWQAIRWIWLAVLFCLVVPCWWLPRSIRQAPKMRSRFGSDPNEPALKGEDGVEDSQQNGLADGLHAVATEGDANAPASLQEWLDRNPHAWKIRYGPGRVWMVRNPFFWLLQTFRPLPIWQKGFVYGGVGIGVLLVGLALMEFPGRRSEILFFFALLLAYGLHQLFKLLVGLTAVTGIVEGRSNGLIELLLISGIPAENIREGHRKAIRTQFRGPMSALLLLQTLLLVFGLNYARGSGADSGTSIFLTLVIATGAILLFLDCSAIISRGMRQALVHDKPIEAFRATCLPVLLPGWILLVVWVILLISVSFSGAPFGIFAITFAVSLWWTLRLERRAEVDLRHGFYDLLHGLPFDSDEWSLRDDFRRAASVDTY